jgi:hypothetical protein
MSVLIETFDIYWRGIARNSKGRRGGRPAIFFCWIMSQSGTGLLNKHLMDGPKQRFERKRGLSLVISGQNWASSPLQLPFNSLSTVQSSQ